MRFLKEFLKNWKTVGAIAPTSRHAREAMLGAIDFERVHLAVELGPGTGVITRAILERLRPDATLVAVEINERFVTALGRSIPDRRLRRVLGSAADLPAILTREGLGDADCVVSSLPFSNIPPSAREAILTAALHSLKSDAPLVALQYTPLVLPPLLERHFGAFKVRHCWLNLPPSLIYVASKQQEACTAS